MKSTGTHLKVPIADTDSFQKGIMYVLFTPNEDEQKERLKILQNRLDDFRRDSIQGTVNPTKEY